MTNDDTRQPLSWNSAIWGSELSPLEKITLLYIDKMANKKSRSCALTVQQISENASCSSSSIFNCIKNLEKNGYIKRDNQRCEFGGQKANLYTIMLPKKFSN